MKPGDVVRIVQGKGQPTMIKLIVGDTKGVVKEHHPRLKGWWFVRFSDIPGDDPITEALPEVELMLVSAVDRLADLAREDS